MTNNILLVRLLSVSCLTTQLSSYRGCCWWPLSHSWRKVDIKCNTLEPKHKIGWKKGQRLWRLEEDMSFHSDCDVAAAVRLKCISANSCAIRREREALRWWVAMMKPGRGGDKERHGGRERCKRGSKWVREEGIRDGENGKQRWSHLPGHLLQSSLSNQSSLSS